MDNTEQRIQELEKQVKQLTQIYYKNNFSDNQRFVKKIVFDNDVTFADGQNITFNATTGTKIGASTSKLAFYGDTPITQPASIGFPAGGTTIDAESRTAITAIILTLQNLGLIQ